MRYLTLRLSICAAVITSIAGVAFQALQIASPFNPTALLTCDGRSCSSATFRPSAASLLCVQKDVTPSALNVRIALGSCQDFKNGGSFTIQGTGGTAKGGPRNAGTFEWTVCSTFCNRGQVSRFSFRGGPNALAATPDFLLTTDNITCSTQGLLVYPSVSPADICDALIPLSGQSGASGQTGVRELLSPSPAAFRRLRKPCPSQTRRRVRIIITNGTSSVSIAQPVRVRGNIYELPISNVEAATDFYIQRYTSDAVGATGSVETITVYTIQHVQSRRYVVADVSDDVTLNVDHRASGINLEDGADFSAGYATAPDYRFFAEYSAGVGNGSVFCPIYHRTYCLFPSTGGRLHVAPLDKTCPRATPSFINPNKYQISSFLTDAASAGGLLGKWYFKFIDTVTPLPPSWRP